MGLYCDILSIPAHAIEKCEQFADNEKGLVDHIQSSAAGDVAGVSEKAAYRVLTKG